MSRSEYIFTSFDIQIPYKNIAADLTVAIPTISLVNHKSVFCQRKMAKRYPGIHRKSQPELARRIEITLKVLYFRTD
jgi:hypothetical protein